MTTITISTHDGSNRHDPEFRAELESRIRSHANVDAVDIGGGCGEGGSDFDFEIAGDPDDIDALIDDLRVYYAEVRAWEE